MARGNAELAKLLLTHGANADLPASRGTTVLAAAAGHGQAELVKLLLAHGAKVNAQGAYGRTPLHVAAWKDDVAIGRLLLKHGADPSLKCNGNSVQPRSAEFRALLVEYPTKR
jgi:ankyrin repeat protein